MENEKPCGFSWICPSFLNTIITEKEVNETEADMTNENVSHAILITNKHVDQDVKQHANSKGIEIWDREAFI